MIFHPQGNPDNKLWMILDCPEVPKENGKFYSYGLDKVLFETWLRAGLPAPFVLGCRWQPEKDMVGTNVKTTSGRGRTKKVTIWGDAGYNCLRQIQTEIDKYKPAIIALVGKRITSLLIPDSKQKGNATEASLEKYAGNLLKSSYIGHEHWVVPCQPPDYLAIDWSYNRICRDIDFGHIKEEWEYFNANRTIKPYEHRELITAPSYDLLMRYLTNECGRAKFLSTDIETIRPPKTKGKKNISEEAKLFVGHPGYPYTLGLAPSPYLGISFSFWDYETTELTRIWREVGKLLRYIPQIGQNYFTFDAHFLEAMGFDICLDKCRDTMIRHHILWPELEHKLQFLTKQYTRIPYYKDEGKNWNPKQKVNLMRYNALDVVATFEVHNEQEKEFDDRPHLR